MLKYPIVGAVILLLFPLKLQVLKVARDLPLTKTAPAVFEA